MFAFHSRVDHAGLSSSSHRCTCSCKILRSSSPRTVYCCRARLEAPQALPQIHSHPSEPISRNLTAPNRPGASSRNHLQYNAVTLSLHLRRRDHPDPTATATTQTSVDGSVSIYNTTKTRKSASTHLLQPLRKLPRAPSHARQLSSLSIIPSQSHTNSQKGSPQSLRDCIYPEREEAHASAATRCQQATAQRERR